MTGGVDTTRCPLCGESNQCGMAAGATECWCFGAKISADVLERVPDAARGVACVCASCAAKGAARSEKQRQLEALLRRRG
jgi:hypothetical protein